MKQQGFERLKAVCEKEGFEIVYNREFTQSSDHVVVIRNKKDIWDGVEYIFSPYSKSIRKIKERKGDVDFLLTDGTYLLQTMETPSTEQAYVEQLKKEAFERFGDSTTRARIDFLEMKGGSIETEEVWVYRKDIDTLYWWGDPIYQSGKWATKPPEKIGVEFHSHAACGNSDFHSHVFTLDVSRNSKQFDPEKAGEFLAKKLEDYLNGEIE